MGQILFAEDEDVIRNMCKSLIQERFLDYEVETFPDGNSLIGRLEQDVSNVRLVLTDNNMPPGLMGSEIIQKYARDARFRDIPFVLFYAGEKEIGEKAVEYGAFTFIEKPFVSIESFLKILQEALKKYSS
jgi:CheY-like chemotaxis protein